MNKLVFKKRDFQRHDTRAGLKKGVSLIRICKRGKEWILYRFDTGSTVAVESVSFDLMRQARDYAQQFAKV